MSSETSDAIRLALLKAAAANYKAATENEKGPITSETLSITKTGGWTGLVSVIVAAIGAITAATLEASPAVTVGALGFAAIALIAVALVIQSDHSARAAVTVGMAQMAPSLIAALHPTATEAASASASPVSSTNFVAVSPTLKATLKNEDDDADIFALRFDTKGDSTSITYLVGRPGHSDLQWKTEAQISMVAR